MLRDLRYLFAYTLPLSAFAALYLQGWWSFSAVVYAFGIIPLVDYFAPQAKANTRGEEEDSKASRRFFDWLLYANVPIFYIIVDEPYGGAIKVLGHLKRNALNVRIAPYSP